MFQHLNNMPMTIFGDGEQTRAFSFIDDSLVPLWIASQAPEASKQIINLGGIEEISIKEAALTLQQVIGGGELIHLESRHEVKHAVPTHQKSIDILNFKYDTSLKVGLEKMWQWAQEQPMRDRFVWPSYELEKGIYSFWKN